MEKYDRVKSELTAVEERLKGISQLVLGIRNIASGLLDYMMADDLSRRDYLHHIEAQQSEQDSYSKKAAMEELVRSTDVMHMVEMQVAQFEASIDSLPESAKPMMAMVKGLFDTALMNAKQRQQQAQQYVEEQIGKQEIGDPEDGTEDDPKSGDAE